MITCPRASLSMAEGRKRPFLSREVMLVSKVIGREHYCVVAS